MLDFLGIGARKAATTWVYKKLCMHPETYFPLGKEVHYWDNFDRLGGGGYRNKFEKTSFADQNGFKCGEITPSYALLESRVISEVKKFSAECRVFYVVRNPIDCVWSTLKHNFRLSKRNIKSATEKDFAEILNDSRTMAHYDYASNIESWKEYFGDILVLDYSEISEEPKNFMRKLSTHLEICPDFYDILPEVVLADVVHTSKGGGIPDDFLYAAVKYYKDKILELQPLLDKDLSFWIEPKK